ncbi:hypothetical protein EJF36_11660 [Bacillus sp. HMF5848]|uniref:Hsp20 family protein n=1 Tax=Bacillus sp. HMF5848 TaxID=2495421 RepID=UPI000F7973F7|nr:Hsp20 family protein [Bacillus sp. HMF5848]RSK27486.1 hypothetical protein EJF36_11660 [Bacillus sp. HMF5848]
MKKGQGKKESRLERAVKNMFQANSYSSSSNGYSHSVQHLPENILIEMKLPGIKKEHLSYEYVNGNLRIQIDQRDGPLVTETIFVGDNIDESNIQATFLEGVLSLTLKKLDGQ